MRGDDEMREKRKDERKDERQEMICKWRDKMKETGGAGGAREG